MAIPTVDRIYHRQRTKCENSLGNFNTPSATGQVAGSLEPKLSKDGDFSRSVAAEAEEVNSVTTPAVEAIEDEVATVTAAADTKANN